MPPTPPPAAPPCISYFFVPADEGVTVSGTWNPVGMRATASRSIQIDAWVPRHQLLGGVEGLGLVLASTMPHWLVASYAAVYLGVAAAALDAGQRLLGARNKDGRVSSAMRARLGRADSRTAAARLVVQEAARAVDRSPSDPETIRWVYRAKLEAGDAAMEVASSLAEAVGLTGLTRGGALELAWRDARLGAVMPPRSDVCADVLGGLALGVDPGELEDAPW